MILNGPFGTILLKYFFVFAVVALILIALRIMHIFRARAMRALAVRLGFQYIGPSAPKWWNPSHLKISPPLPAWLSHVHPSGRQIRQIWNVIEGQQNGVSVLIFDSAVGLRGGAPCTLVACQIAENPFGIIKSSDRLIQPHGWTVLHGVWFLWFSWFMGIKRLDNHVSKLRIGVPA